MRLPLGARRFRRVPPPAPVPIMMTSKSSGILELVGVGGNSLQFVLEPATGHACLVPQNVAGIAAWMFDEIFLVVFLGRIEFPGSSYLRCNRPTKLARLSP